MVSVISPATNWCCIYGVAAVDVKDYVAAVGMRLPRTGFVNSLKRTFVIAVVIAIRVAVVVVKVVLVT